MTVMTPRQEQVRSLRSLLVSRPRNARAMSQLACLLLEESVELERCIREETVEDLSEYGDVPARLRRQSIDLARRAVAIAPRRYFAQGTLSRVSEDHDERMESLRLALDIYSDVHPQHHRRGREEEEGGGGGGHHHHDDDGSFLAGGLVRLLVEPREEEGRRFDGLSRASPCHPSRRDLSDDESTLYGRAREALAVAWGKNDHAMAKGNEGDDEATSHMRRQADYLALLEYRLGLFFRKMQPQGVHRATSRGHFENVARRGPGSNPVAVQARFWCATFETDPPHGAGVGGGSRSAAGDVVDRCPEEYIVSLYSGFARTFDDLLVRKLDYDTPSLLRRLVDGVVLSNGLGGPLVGSWGGRWAARAVDLGCGTGISGVAFRDCARHLTGVDLSSEMTVKAREKGCYDVLLVSELETYLRGLGAASMDLVVACDVFVYIGELRSVFRCVQRAMAPGGLFAFSTEWIDEGAIGERPYVLLPTARFAHKLSYIEELAVECGFVKQKVKVSVIRKNQGKDVKGILAVLRLH